MRTVHDWLGEYGASHLNPVNRTFHFVCIPLIVFAIVCALKAAPVGNAMLNAATLVMIAALAYYLWLSWRLALGLVAVFAVRRMPPRCRSRRSAASASSGLRWRSSSSAGSASSSATPSKAHARPSSGTCSSCSLGRYGNLPTCIVAWASRCAAKATGPDINCFVRSGHIALCPRKLIISYGRRSRLKTRPSRPGIASPRRFPDAPWWPGNAH